MDREDWVSTMYTLGITTDQLMNMSNEEFLEAKRFAYNAGLSPIDNIIYSENNSFEESNSKVSYVENNYNDYSRYVIEEQDDEYLKAERKQLELQEKERKNMENAKYLLDRMENKIRECSKIGESKKGKVEVLIRFPNNSKLIKRFDSSSLSDDIYQCALSKKESWNADSTEKHILVRDPLGRVISNNKSLKELGITKRTVLTVEYE